MASDNMLNEYDLDIPEGFRNLIKGYLDYAREVIMERADPGIDGLKPVHRRILYCMHWNKQTSLTKSATVVGGVLRLHPHADSTVYDSLVHLTNTAEYQTVPFIKGKGNFGKSYSSEMSYAASRYTECCLNTVSEELFREMDGIKMIPSYDNSTEEPECLPVSFPNILCNANMGIAVGVASNIPSFNFVDVNNAVIELIEKGHIVNPLVPDFPTKGCIVRNNHECTRLLHTGGATFKLRGKWCVDGRTIVITEIPYYTTIEKIKKVATEFQDVTEVQDVSDLTGMCLNVVCRSKKVVDSVLLQLLRDTDLQMTFHANMFYIYNNRPRYCGIEDLLKDWVEFRTDVLKKHITLGLEGIRTNIVKNEYQVRLFSDTGLRNGLLDALRESEAAGVAYLRENLEGVPDFVIDWLLGKTLRGIAGMKAQTGRLEALRKAEQQAVFALENIPAVIVSQLGDLNRKYGAEFARKTEITDKDYIFEKKEKEVIVAESASIMLEVNGKFIKKMRSFGYSTSKDAVQCMSDDTLALIDSKGRILRVYLENLEYVSSSDRGVYLPVFLGIPDDFEVMCAEIVDDVERCYMFNDGYVGVVNFGEWKNSSRHVRVLENGFSELAANLIGEVDLSKPYVYVQTKGGKCGFFQTVFKHKSRTARTKLFTVKNDVVTMCISLSMTDYLNASDNSVKYTGKLLPFESVVSLNTELLNSLR